MKKIYFMLTAMLMTLVFSSCNNGKTTASNEQEEEQDVVDYAAIVDKEFPSIDEFFKMVDNFQQATKDVFSGRNPWDECRAASDTVIKPKGFTIIPKDNDNPMFLAATKNCKLDTEKGYFEVNIVPEDTTKLAAAITFNPCGDMYDKGCIVVNDVNIYNAIIDKVKAAGYNESPDHQFADVDSKVFAKDVYFFKCNEKEKRIELHYDFMKAQEQQFGN